VYREHADFVLRVVCQLGVGPLHVEDVVHDVFLVVHRRLHEYDGRSMRSWLYGITRRVVLHHHRGSARTQRREAEHAPLPVGVVDPEQRVVLARAAELVERFVASLDEDQRIVFVLADLEGTPVPEIAAALGVNVNTIYSRLRLARRRFEQAIAEEAHG
jgi:RNA polymerase sigma-70 factor (ECF subfamily)